MDWYAAHYAHDPAAGNVFGRALHGPRADPLLRAWLECGGSVSGFIRARLDQGPGMAQLGLPSAHSRRDAS